LKEQRQSSEKKKCGPGVIDMAELRDTDQNKSQKPEEAVNRKKDKETQKSK
jgi:hypothetical protein